MMLPLQKTKNTVTVDSSWSYLSMEDPIWPGLRFISQTSQTLNFLSKSVNSGQMLTHNILEFSQFNPCYVCMMGGRGIIVLTCFTWITSIFWYSWNGITIFPVSGLSNRSNSLDLFHLSRYFPIHITYSEKVRQRRTLQLQQGKDG